MKRIFHREHSNRKEMEKIIFVGWLFSNNVRVQKNRSQKMGPTQSYNFHRCIFHVRNKLRMRNVFNEVYDSALIHFTFSFYAQHKSCS